MGDDPSWVQSVKESPEYKNVFGSLLEKFWIVFCDFVSIACLAKQSVA